MNRFKFIIAIFLLLVAVYPAYKIKSALGIDLIANHHAPDAFKYANVYTKKAITKLHQL
ncbi:hypothetical protein [Crocosphaera sp. XPORK-15E]|uniref:hypothetical protein n=1 Tax=Crocosphaera sp. XPORK-15E TaxID=3110247 RepID=UPI002B1F74A5|nr:hypothetical protein [Crocosphaera sp. XPORK-15E]MEA5533323.1 hypothetical protein [Crocosphaera sp. XPORK-15E]